MTDYEELERIAFEEEGLVADVAAAIARQTKKDD